MLLINDNTINKIVSSDTEDVPSIEHINLGGNKLRFIDFEFFEKFSNLKELILSRNKLIGTIDMGKLQTLKKLSKILLDGNKITGISNTATKNMPSVGDIILSNNKLTSLNLEDLKKFVNLRNLVLIGNQLTFINGYTEAKTILPNIEYITINRNEFKCDYLKKMTFTHWVPFWYESQDIEEETCSEPKSVHYDDRICCYP